MGLFYDMRILFIIIFVVCVLLYITSNREGFESDLDNIDPDNIDPDNIDPDNIDPDNIDPDNIDPDNSDNYAEDKLEINDPLSYYNIKQPPIISDDTFLGYNYNIITQYLGIEHIGNISVEATNTYPRGIDDIKKLYN
jgi:hypothetical protein